LNTLGNVKNMKFFLFNDVISRYIFPWNLTTLDF